MNSESAPSTILTLHQAAAHLQIARKTCGELARRGRIPAFKVGRQWRFVKSELDAWALEQARANVRPRPAAGVAAALVRVNARAAGSSLASRLEARLAATREPKGK